jgi:hypothetical protein
VEEEELILVRTVDRDGRAEGPQEYVQVDWGPLFAAQHGAGAAFGEPGLQVGLGPLGLSYILRAGGMGYFRRGVATPFIEAGELEAVAGAPAYTYPAYAVYAETSEPRADLQDALRGLREIVQAAGFRREKMQLF